jgi:hypothetical protein
MYQFDDYYKNSPKYGEIFTCETGEYLKEYSLLKLFFEYSSFLIIIL